MMSLRCQQVEPADGAADDTITLEQTDRHRRRLRMQSDGGIVFLLELDAACLLRDGDHLVLDDGRRIAVRSAPEALYEVRGSDADHLLLIAWHLGNRHLLTEIRAGHLRVRADPVIADMLGGLGATTNAIRAGFDPEGGAYARSRHSGNVHGCEADQRPHDIAEQGDRGNRVPNDV